MHTAEINRIIEESATVTYEKFILMVTDDVDNLAKRLELDRDDKQFPPIVSTYIEQVIKLVDKEV